MTTAYNRQYNFANYQLLNPTAPLPGVQVDAEYNAIKAAVDALISDLGLIQNAEGELQNGIVRPQNLASDFLVGIAAPEAWATSTNKAVDETVFYEGKLYICVTAHLTGVFATDLAAGKWELVADFQSAVDSAINIGFTPGGTISADNVQEALAEVAADAAQDLADLAAVDFLVKTASTETSAERVVTDTTTIKWDWAAAGQAKAEKTVTVLAKTADATITKAQKFSLVTVDTSGSAVALTLPSLTSDDAGWYVDVVKVNTGTNPVFILPPSGNLYSGGQAVAKTRRSIPHVIFRVQWTGSVWVVERSVTAPIGAVLDLTTASLPVGYEWPNGQTLSSASTNFPDFYAANGSSGVVRDCRGRVVAGKDDMGGTSANRLTGLSGGVDGDTLGATGGAETHTLTEAQMAAHTHTATVSTDGAHTHTYGNFVATQSGIGTSRPNDAAGTGATTSSAGDHTHTVTNASTGGGAAHNNVQPTIVLNKILVVE